MEQNRELVHKWLGVSEGGYVNHPNDPGGPTNMGVTQKTYDAWRRSINQGWRDVRNITKEEVKTIFDRQYLDPVRFADLPSGLDYAMADYSVNSGPGKAVRDLQTILGVSRDGVLGAHTLAAVKAKDIEQLIVALCERRMKFLRGLKTWPTFGKGWSARVMGRYAGAQTDDIGVIDRAVRLSRKTSPEIIIPDPKAPEDPAKAPPPEPKPATDKTTDTIAVAVGGSGLSGIFAAVDEPWVQALLIGTIALGAVGYLIIRSRDRKNQ